MKSITLPIPSIRNRTVLAIDALMVVVTVLGSYALRSELNNTFFFYLPSAIWMALAGLAIKPLVYHFFGLYRRMWLYASTQELKLIFAAVTGASVLVSATMIGLTSMRLFVGFPHW
jgi:FlaA1/EpsC-like NDP-sugar epimerase